MIQLSRARHPTHFRNAIRGMSDILSLEKNATFLLVKCETKFGQSQKRPVSSPLPSHTRPLYQRRLSGGRRELAVTDAAPDHRYGPRISPPQPHYPLTSLQLLCLSSLWLENGPIPHTLAPFSTGSAHVFHHCNYLTMHMNWQICHQSILHHWSRALIQCIFFVLLSLVID